MAVQPTNEIVAEMIKKRNKGTEDCTLTSEFARSIGMNAPDLNRALKDMGKNVPADISVVGFDGIDIGRLTLPRLTTVEQPVDEIARRSVNLLLDMMEKDAAPRHILVEAALRKRESTARCRPD